MLVLLGLAVYLPGLVAIPPVDRDESRFAQASRQMHESGDYLIPRIQDRPRLNKPPLIYWLQSGSIALFGDRPGQYPSANIWVFRLPSLFCALGTILLTWRIGLRLFDPRAAALGAALFAVSPMVVWDAHQARADQLLLFCTTATQLFLLRCLAPPPRGRGLGGGFTNVPARPNFPSASLTPSPRHPLTPSLLFWLSLSAGILAKGPITPLITGLTLLVLGLSTRRWRWLLNLRPLLGLIIVPLVVAPWIILVANRVGWSEFLRIASSETIGRSTSPRENHWFPPGFHLVLFSILFWPGSLLTAIGLFRTFKRAFARRSPTSALRHPATLPLLRPRFLLAWIIPSWLFFELISTKLPHYVMPLYPALALLSARAVFAADRGVIQRVRDVGSRIGFAIWLLIGAAATLGLSIVVVLQGRLDPDAPLLHAARGLGLPAAVIIVGLIAAARALQRRQFLRAQLWGLAIATIWGATFLQFILPRAERFWISPRLARAVPPDQTLGAVGFAEDSLIFITRGRAQRLTAEQFASGDFANADWISYPSNTPRPPSLAAPAARISGFNYSNGKRVDLDVAKVSR